MHTRHLARLGLGMLSGACALALVMAPAGAQADDIDYFCEDVVVTTPQSQRPIARQSAIAIQSSPVGTWVEVKRSTSATIIQTCLYYISPNANSDGSVQVTVKTVLQNNNYNGAIFWTTTKTIYDNGTQCAFIGEDWNSKAYHNESISAEATFAVRGGGRHRITSIETGFRGSSETSAGWDFTIDIPYTISSSCEQGGSISPAGNTLVGVGASQGYNVSANDGWRIRDIEVDGTSVGARSNYTFTNVSGNHTIRAKFQKVWKVKFVDGITGETLFEQVVDEGSGATAPEVPGHNGWHFSGWDGDFSHVGSDLTITATYEPTISVRVPSLIPCRILADGSVAAPSGYAIENLSVVPVRAQSITTSGMPADASYTLRDGDTVVHEWSGSDKNGSDLRIGSSASKELALSVSNVTGAGEWRALAEAATASGNAQELCTITYTFEAAS